MQDYCRIDTLVAQVKMNNLRSQKVLRSLGYMETVDENNGIKEYRLPVKRESVSS